MLHVRDKEIQENSNSTKRRRKKAAVLLLCTQTASFEMHLLQKEGDFAEAFLITFERSRTTL